MPIKPTTKFCPQCGESKSSDQFYGDPRVPSGLASWCKECTCDRQRGKYRERHPKEETPEGHRRCPHCKEVMPASEFTADRRRSDGLSVRCRECVRSARAERVERFQSRALQEGSKRCVRCDKVKPYAHFSANPQMKDGRQSWCRDCYHEYRTEWRQTEVGRRKMKADGLRRYFGMTITEHEELLEQSGGGCRACGSREKLHVDHCHQTGRIRGILCGGCNRALGMLGDDPDRVEKLLRYAREHCAQPT